MLQTRYLIALSCLGFFACTTTEPVVTNVRLRVGLPQNAAAFDSIVVTATQGENVVEGEVAADLSMTFTLAVGVEATIAATLLEHDGTGIFAYEGATTFTPDPTTTDIIVDTPAVPSRVGSILPVFSDGSELIADVAFTVTDDVSQVVFPDPFPTRVSFSLPVGRSFSLAGQNPLTGDPIVFQLDDTTVFGEDTEVIVGPPPVAPVGNPYKPIGFFTVSDLHPAPGYTVSCAVGGECPGTELTWDDCAAITAPLAAMSVDDDYAVLVHYNEAPSVCSSLLFVVDATPPLLKVSYDPPFFAPGTPRTVTATLESDDYLDASLLSVTETGGDGTELCHAAAGQVGFWQCELSLPAGSGVRLLTVSATDLSGNTTTIESNLVDLADATPTGVEIVALRLAGWGPTSGDQYIPFVVTVQNFSDSIADVQLSDAMLDDVQNPGLQGVMFRWVDDVAAHEIELGGGASRDLWGTLFVSEPTVFIGTGPSFSITPSVQVDYGAAVSLTFQLRVVDRPLRWVSPGLAISSLVGSAPTMRSFTVPLAGGGAGMNGYPDLRSADDTIVVGSGNELIPLAAGETTVTALLTDPAVSRAAHVLVYPAPTLLMLFGDDTGIELRERTPGIKDDTLTTIPPAIGTPLKVLWDSVSDSVSVVGTLGVYERGSAATQTLEAPCGGTIVSATMQGGHILLLVDLDGTQFAHCELDPTGSVTTPLTLENIDTATTDACTPRQILGNPIADQILVVGVSGIVACAFEYRLASGLTVFQSAGSLVGTPVASAYDPWGSFAATLVDNDNLPFLVGWGTGTSLYEPPVPYMHQYDAGASASAWGAVGMDLVTGDTLVTSAERNDNSSVAVALLARLTGRFGSPRDLAMSFPISSPAVAGELPLYPALTIDSANRRLYTMNAGASPTLTVVSLDDLGGFDYTDGIVLTSLPVVDLAIAGPQPLALSTDALMPGAVVTVNGVGFVGNNLDEVFVQGIAAETRSSTTTSATFVVPPALAGVAAGLDDAWVTVRSHGRMSGPVYGRPYEQSNSHARVPPPSEGRSIGMRPSYQSLCGGGACMVQPPLLAGPAGYPLVHSTSLDPMLELFDANRYQSINLLIPTPPGGATFFGNRRYLGVISDNNATEPLQYWQTINVPLTHSNYPSLYPETPRAAVPYSYGLPAATAVYPNDRLVATLEGTDVRFFSSTTLEEVPPGMTSGLSDPAGLVFAPDASALFITGSQEIEVSTLSPSPSAPVAVPLVLDACPGSELGTLLTLSPFGPDGELTAIYSFPAISPQALMAASLHPDPIDGWRLECLATRDFGLSAVVQAAAVSPTGDTLAATVLEPWHSQNTVWVMRRADLFPWSNNLNRMDSDSLIDLLYSRDGKRLVVLEIAGTSGAAIEMQEISDLPVDPASGQGG